METSNDCSASPSEAIPISECCWSTARDRLFIASQENGFSKPMVEKQRKLGTSKTCVAVANKNARIIWTLLVKEKPYRLQGRKRLQHARWPVCYLVCVGSVVKV